MDLSDVLPTLAELAGARVPRDRPIDGRSFAPILRGEKGNPREWIFAFIGYSRILRTERWLLERNTPRDFGQLYDCGDSRDGSGYRDVTNSTEPEVIAIKKKFTEMLKDFPTLEMPEKGSGKNKKRRKQKATEG